MKPTAVVTGGGSGIGRAAALALADADFSVVVVGRRQGPLAQTAAERPGAIHAATCDVRDPSSVGAVFGHVAATHGHLDLLFNNAGVLTETTPLEEVTPTQWSEAIDTIVTGAFLCTQQAFQLMKSQTPRGGRIINNGSVSAITPRPMSVPYTVAKHALTGLTKSTALDGRPYDIACGQIDIGNATTEMTIEMRTGAHQADGNISTEHMMEVADVARAIVYMATLPLEANVLSMTLLATKMPFIGRG